VVKKTKAMIVALTDSPQNILNRITFYDIDSGPVAKNLSEKERRLYLREIKNDISHFRRTYERATLTVDIAGLGPEGAARRVRDALLA
jgi:shikimate kinase